MLGFFKVWLFPILLPVIGIGLILIGWYSLDLSEKNNSKINLESISHLKNIDSDSESNFAFYASKSGKKYYPWWCESTIKEGNRVFFNTETEVLAAGYEGIAKSCQ